MLKLGRFPSTNNHNMMQRLLNIILVYFGASGCWAYNFKNPYYNDLILENMLVRKNSQPIFLKSNNRDGTECQRPSKFECCDNLNPENLYQLELTAVECYVEQTLASEDTKIKPSKMYAPLDVFSCARLKKLQEEYVCLAECVAKKQKIINESTGSLLGPDVLVPFVKLYYAEGVYTDEQLDEFVQGCSNYTEQVTKECPTDFRCGTAAASFGYCMWRKTMVECPLDRQSTTPSCDNLRIDLATMDDRCLSV